MNGYIDLKQAQLFIQDGYSASAAVNNASGYTTGATTMVIDGIAAIVATGTEFTLAGDDTVYVVTAHVETSSHTTSLTFAPGLVVAATDNEVITFLAHKVEVRIGEGNLTYTQKKTREYKKNRGKLDVVRNADEDQLDVSFDFVWDHLVSTTGEEITIEEALDGKGAAASWVSSSTETCEPYAVDLIILYTPICSTVEPEKIIFPDFRYDTLEHNLKDGTVNCKGSCNATTPVITRIAG